MQRTVQTGGSPGNTRRALLLAAAGACIPSWNRVFGAKRVDFWNTEDPAKWSSGEIQKLLTESPWAKGIDVQLPGYGPGPGAGQSGGGRGGRKSRGGTNGSAPNPGLSPKFPGTVRWASAKPILMALKMELPHELAGHYVISVSGVPVISGASSDDSFDGLKQVTLLRPKGKDSIPPGIIMADSQDTSTLLFGFLPQLADLSGEKPVSFSMKMGPLNVKAKFNPKEMRYRGDLAL
ncbi:MAG TPA: hypothetical protein VK604_23425 [Bryobacteraceae bacterium]|nr:hypothetical protein [Bryobacteraceae bacterium]